MQRVILWGFFVPEKEGKSNHKNPIKKHRISIYHFIENSWLVHEKHPKKRTSRICLDQQTMVSAGFLMVG